MHEHVMLLPDGRWTLKTAVELKRGEYQSGTVRDTTEKGRAVVGQATVKSGTHAKERRRQTSGAHRRLTSRSLESDCVADLQRIGDWRRHDKRL
jgi:hypothetical protein